MFFETRNQVPDIYTSESRDFQLFESLLDVIFNYNISNTRGIDYLRYPLKTDNALLKLLCDYVGFFTNTYYPDELLRSIILNFPYLIKKKGTIASIKEAIIAIQQAYTSRAQVEVVEDARVVEDERRWTYVIHITEGVPVDRIYIDSILQYLRPVGIVISDILATSATSHTYSTSVPTENKPILLHAHNKSETIDSTSKYLYGYIRKAASLYRNPLDPSDPDAIIIENESTDPKFADQILSGVSHTPIVKTRSFIETITEIKL